MSGDWIKVEHATVNKPEVLRLARLWGVNSDHVLGVLMRFWVWLDNASVDGRVDGVASHELDDMMRMPGFAQGMVAVSWLSVSEDPPSISVPHFSEHNGETSKKRALKNKRQSRWRSTNVDGDVDAPTTQPRLPEKRREDLSTNVDRVRSPKRLQEPTHEHQALAQSLGVSCETEFLKYHDYLAANGKRHASESAGFRNWLRKAGDFKPDGPPVPLMQASHKPAKIPELPHTDMPEAARTALAAFKGRH